MVFILQGLSPDTGTAVQQIAVNHFHGTLVVCQQSGPYDGLAEAVFFPVEKPFCRLLVQPFPHDFPNVFHGPVVLSPGAFYIIQGHHGHKQFIQWTYLQAG